MYIYMHIFSVTVREHIHELVFAYGEARVCWYKGSVTVVIVKWYGGVLVLV